MTKREAAVVSAFTGVMLGKFSDMHEYIEEKLQRPVFTHQLANDETVKEVKDKSKQDFCSLSVT